MSADENQDVISCKNNTHNVIVSNVNHIKKKLEKTFGELFQNFYQGILFTISSYNNITY